MKQLHGVVDAHGYVDSEKVDAYLTELDITAKLRHPSIIMLLAAVLDPTNLCLVLELGNHGNLQAAARDRKRSFPRALALRFLKSIASGVEYLHSWKPPFVHRDIKTENMLLVGTGPFEQATAKLADVRGFTIPQSVHCVVFSHVTHKTHISTVRRFEIPVRDGDDESGWHTALHGPRDRTGQSLRRKRGHICPRNSIERSS